MRLNQLDKTKKYKVRIKSWEEMETVYGLNGHDNIDTPVPFKKSQLHMCDRIIEIEFDDIRNCWTNSSLNGYCFHDDKIGYIVPKSRELRRGIAFYKESYEPWTLKELNDIEIFCGDDITTYLHPLNNVPETKNKYVYDIGLQKEEHFMYPWNEQEIPEYYGIMRYEEIRDKYMKRY